MEAPESGVPDLQTQEVKHTRENGRCGNKVRILATVNSRGTVVA